MNRTNSHSAVPMHAASMSHGGVFGAEGALLSLPSMCSTSVHTSSVSATVLVLSGAGLAQLRASQPLLLQKLLTAAFAQQQDFLHMISRRTALWLGGGRAGPKLDVLVARTVTQIAPTLGHGEKRSFPGSCLSPH